MKYFKTSNTYKASNVKFNPETIEAWSYDWWKFVTVINGKVIFNNFRFSSSTIKHQYKVKHLMSELGVKIDLEIACPSGFQNKDYFISINDYYSEKIKELKDAINRPRSQARKNDERKAEIENLVKLCLDFKKIDETK